MHYFELLKAPTPRKAMLLFCKLPLCAKNNAT